MEHGFNLKRLGGRKPQPPEARFDASYMPEPMSGCWLWLGTERGSNGYGSLKVDGKLIAAHRYSYQRHVSEIPAGLLVLHRCDNPACVNPNHLFLGTDQDNSDDKVKKQRQARGAALVKAQAKNKARGEANGNSRLTSAQVEEIRAMPLPQRAMAKKFGVSQAIISKIKRKEAWK